MVNHQEARVKMHLLEPGTSQNETKPSETVQNQPKQLKK